MSPVSWGGNLGVYFWRVVDHGVPMFGGINLQKTARKQNWYEDSASILIEDHNCCICGWLHSFPLVDKNTIRSC